MSNLSRLINFCQRSVQTFTGHTNILPASKSYTIVNYLMQMYLHEKLMIRLYRELAAHSSDKKHRAFFLSAATSHERRAAQLELMLLKAEPKLKRFQFNTFNKVWCWFLLRLGRYYTVRWIRQTTTNDINRLVYLLSHSDENSAFPPLPDVRLEDVNRVILILASHGGYLKMTALAKELGCGISILSPILTAGELLGLLQVDPVLTTLTILGKSAASTPMPERKTIFRHQAIICIPLLQWVDRVLHEYSEAGINAQVVRDVLHQHFANELVERQFARLVEWGRYMSLFDYDANADSFLSYRVLC